MTKETAPTLDHVLMRFAETVDTPNERVLRDWLADYPQFAQELIEFATDWLERDAARAQVDFTQADFDSIVNRTMSRAQQLLDETPPTDVVDLHAEIRRAGYSTASFVRLVGVDQSILDCLFARLVKGATIPARLIEAMSDALDRSADSLRAYFRLPPQQALAFKASSQPVLNQVDFSDLIRQSSLQEDVRLRWLSEAPDPKLGVPPDG
jgi:hypothetical protein